MNQTNPKKWKGLCRGETFNSSLCNSKIIGAKYFNKGLKENYNGMIVDSARDCVGHGTQVASIAAGNYVEKAYFFRYAEGTTAKGVAPLPN